ncbi:MAG: MFS transporter [Candidatus Dormibacteraeota bacterium]|nr:MFS transporter [Candidatus Dormibacteraeota bacterium]
MAESSTLERTSTARKAVGMVRWLMVLLAFVGTTINYVDRANLGVANTLIRKDLHIPPGLMGIAIGSFFISYAVFQLPNGYLVDRIGARIMYTFAVAWWSVFTAATALARGFFSLFVLRLLLGVGESGAYPSNAKIVAEWFPLRERGTATSIYDSGARFGTVASLPIVTWLILNIGWRGSFLATGALGLVWAVAFVLLYRRPRQHFWVKQEELAYIEQGSRSPDLEAERVPVRWVDLFRYRTIWGMMIGFFCLNFVIYFFITWFPDYLTTARHFSLPKLGTVGTIPALAAIPGGWLGGIVADTLVRRGMDLTKARKLCLVGGMACASVIALVALAPSAAVAIALLSVAYASLTFAAASVWCLPADVAPSPNQVASIGGIQNFASNISGVITSIFTGVVLQITGNYVISLFAMGGFALLGAISYLFIVGKIEPLEAKGGDPRLTATAAGGGA